MATSVLEKTHMQNAYLDQIGELPKEQKQSSTWLIIAHDEPSLVHKLQDALVDSQAILLRVPQSHWKRDRELIEQAVEETLKSSAVQQIALVGHSQASPTVCKSQLLGETSGQQNGDVQDSYKRLMRGVQTAQTQREQAKQDVIQQYNYLASTSCVAGPEGSESPELHAFFYMAETGLFLKFNPDTQSFED